MITLEQYFGLWKDHPDVTEIVRLNADDLLRLVNSLMNEAEDDGIVFRINPSTMSRISGTDGGGFRPLDYPVGSANSSHKQGLGVDVYDGPISEGGPFGKWCMANQKLLEDHGLYMEHTSCTVGKWSLWVHLTSRAPKSGKRVFYP